MEFWSTTNQTCALENSYLKKIPRIGEMMSADLFKNSPPVLRLLVRRSSILVISLSTFSFMAASLFFSNSIEKSFEMRLQTVYVTNSYYKSQELNEKLLHVLKDKEMFDEWKLNRINTEIPENPFEFSSTFTKPRYDEDLYVDMRSLKSRGILIVRGRDSDQFSAIESYIDHAVAVTERSASALIFKIANEMIAKESEMDQTLPYLLPVLSFRERLELQKFKENGFGGKRFYVTRVGPIKMVSPKPAILMPLSAVFGFFVAVVLILLNNYVNRRG